MAMALPASRSKPFSPTRAAARLESGLMNDAPIRGLWCATLTPLAADGGIDHARLAAHVRQLFAQGVDGIAPFGTTGEGQSFSVDERRAGLDALLVAGIPAVRIVVGTGCAALPDTVALTRHALRAGVTRCLVLPPFFFKELPDDAVYDFYARCIDAVGDARLRVYLYHIPQISAVAIAPDVVARLAAAYPAIIAGVKDSAGDWTNTAQLLECAPQLSILVGHEPHLPRLLRAGGAGTICGIANVYPRLVAALLEAEVTPAAEARIKGFIDILFRYPFLPAFKAIRAAQAADPGWLPVRTPQLPLGEHERAALLEELRVAGLLPHVREAAQ
jgi:4-hydroxy-tetrahydrodipicolinate synthase